MKSIEFLFLKFAAHIIFLVAAIFFFLSSRLNTLWAILVGQPFSPPTDAHFIFYAAFVWIVVCILFFIGIHFTTRDRWFLGRWVHAAWLSFLFLLVGIFYLDVLCLFAYTVAKELDGMSEIILKYVVEYWRVYVLLFLGAFSSEHLLRKISLPKSGVVNPAWQFGGLMTAAILSPILLVLILPFIDAQVFLHTNLRTFTAVPFALALFLNLFYVGLNGWFLWKGYQLSEENHWHPHWFMAFVMAIGTASIFSFLFDLLLVMVPSIHAAWRNGIFQFRALGYGFDGIFDNWVTYIPLIILSGLCSFLFARLKLSNIHSKKGNTSGYFGRAAWATTKDFSQHGQYNPETGPMGGMDEKGRLLYFPLMNKLTIAPPSGGKSSASAIPTLLTENRPMFVFDIKGELWVTTARYRAEQMWRNIILIDPYEVTKTKDFCKGKSGALAEIHRLNPFDYIPEDERERDRMINAFAQSFIVTEQGYGSQHFDENARTMIRGYIDYIMKSFSKEERSLVTLYDLMSEDAKDAKQTFNAMSEVSGRAAAAANQISRVGMNERGSILSTSYRQIDWMGDKNIQKSFSESTFDLRDFLKGNMDIYIVLPQEQVHEYSRLMRIILALIKFLILQADPSDLPDKKMLFLLDELAQLGYCPDVEEFIEVLRSRGVVVWAVFQSNDQIELYKKPDLFRGMPMKQIFTLDDVATMRWIQALGGKTSVVTRSVSQQSGKSWRESGFSLGSGSRSQTASLQETGVDLIHLSDIREMPRDEQIIFIHGERPVRCKKVFYFKHPYFVGKFDENPLERQKK